MEKHDINKVDVNAEKGNNSSKDSEVQPARGSKNDNPGDDQPKEAMENNNGEGENMPTEEKLEDSDYEMATDEADIMDECINVGQQFGYNPTENEAEPSNPNVKTRKKVGRKKKKRQSKTMVVRMLMG